MGSTTGSHFGVHCLHAWVLRAVLCRGSAWAGEDTPPDSLMWFWSDPGTHFWHLLLFLGLFRLSHETGCLHNTEPVQLKIHFPEKAIKEIQHKTSFTPGLCRMWDTSFSKMTEKIFVFKQLIPQQTKKQNPPISQHSAALLQAHSHRTCVWLARSSLRAFFPLLPNSGSLGNIILIWLPRAAI